MSVRAVKGGEQKHAAIEALGVSNRGNRDIQWRPGTGKRRQRGGDENRGDVLDHHRRGGELDSHLLQEIGQGLHRNHGLLAVARAVQAYHHAIPDQQVVAYSLDRAHVTQANFARRRFLARDDRRQQEHGQAEHANP